MNTKVAGVESRSTLVRLGPGTTRSGRQKPPAQVVPPHECPHCPQFVGLVATLVSHEPLPSQSAVPVAQLKVQVPLAQPACVPGGAFVVQSLLQLPQCRGSFESCDSQPSVAEAFQFPKPALQKSWQPVAMQVAAETFCPPEHWSPQLLQLVVVPSWVSQPLAAIPSQLPQFALQLATAHLPAPQAALALARAHGFLQKPQCAADVSVLVSQSPGLVSQSAIGAVHDDTTHLPAWQTCPVVHLVPHLPQLFGSVWALDSQPVSGSPSQSAKPPVHAVNLQPSVSQLAVALGRVQVAPQFPQLVAVLSGVSQPLLGMPSQLAKPELHSSIWQPWSQVGFAFARAQG